MDVGWAMSFKRYSPSWNRHRRLFTRSLNPTAISKTFSIVQVSATHRLLAAFVSDPSHFKKHLKNASADIILGITYRYNIQPLNDPVVDLAESALILTAEGIRPKYLVNVLPISEFLEK